MQKKWVLSLCVALLCVLPIEFSLAEATAAPTATFAPMPLTAESATIGTFELPRGAQALPVDQVGSFIAPVGLESMYQLMGTANPSSSVYVVRMKNGRALLSISSSYMPKSVTAEELLAQWPQIAANLGKEVLFANDTASCARIASYFGHAALEIKVELVAKKDAMVLLEATGITFYRDAQLLELWVVAPAQATYLYDEVAAAELAADALDVEALMASIDFGGSAQTEASIPPAFTAKPAVPLNLVTERYQDPNGFFSLDMVKGSHVITQDTKASAVNEARQALAQKYGTGAGIAFDVWLADVKDENATLILAPGYEAAIELYALPAPFMAGVKPEALLTQTEDIRQALIDKFTEARALDKGIQALAGARQSYHQFWVRTEKNDMLLYLFAYVEEPDLLREVDIFLMMDQREQDLGHAILNLVKDTLTFTTPE